MLLDISMGQGLAMRRERPYKRTVIEVSIHPRPQLRKCVVVFLMATEIGRALHPEQNIVRIIIERHLGVDRKSTRLNSSHANISYAVFCLKKKNNSRSLHI